MAEAHPIFYKYIVFKGESGNGRQKKSIGNPLKTFRERPQTAYKALVFSRI